MKKKAILIILSYYVLLLNTGWCNIKIYVESDKEYFIEGVGIEYENIVNRKFRNNTSDRFYQKGGVIYLKKGRLGVGSGIIFSQYILFGKVLEYEYIESNADSTNYKESTLSLDDGLYFGVGVNGLVIETIDEFVTVFYDVYFKQNTSKGVKEIGIDDVIITKALIEQTDSRNKFEIKVNWTEISLSGGVIKSFKEMFDVYLALQYLSLTTEIDSSGVILYEGDKKYLIENQKLLKKSLIYFIYGGRVSVRDDLKINIQYPIKNRLNVFISMEYIF